MERIWGRNPVLEALRSGWPIRRILIAYSAEGGPPAEIVRLAAARSVPVEATDRARLDRLATHHQGIVAEVPPFRYAGMHELTAAAASSGQPALLLALDQIQDPQNFGSLLRTADAVGCHGVIMPAHRQVAVTPAVVKSSAGAVLYLRVARVVNLARTIEDLKASGIWSVGLTADASTDYDQIDWSMPAVLVVGSEGRGLGRLVRERCDLLVRLPMLGHVDSLNASVAGSIVLYHAWRWRQRGAVRGS
ncbi:MAG: 23S rRNA (guanosine(2251)-2'-O)-methyltransferase RlmB [Chloroflexi bacterium]|nr:23S rRNA (guanosine(2251)-2'-O)-methyltransferase RlmB [Chloroflexota bacterium]